MVLNFFSDFTSHLTVHLSLGRVCHWRDSWPRKMERQQMEGKEGVGNICVDVTGMSTCSPSLGCSCVHVHPKEIAWESGHGGVAVQGAP